MPRKYPLRLLWLMITVSIYTQEWQGNVATGLEDDNAPRLEHSNEDDGWFITKGNSSGYDGVSSDKKLIYVVKKTYHRNKENPWLSVCIIQSSHIRKQSNFQCLDMDTQ